MYLPNINRDNISIVEVEDYDNDTLSRFITQRYSANDIAWNYNLCELVLVVTGGACKFVYSGKPSPNTECIINGRQCS